MKWSNLYDLGADPGDQVELSSTHPKVVAEFTAEVEEIRRRSGDAHTGNPGQYQRAVGLVENLQPLAVDDPAIRIW